MSDLLFSKNKNIGSSRWNIKLLLLCHLAILLLLFSLTSPALAKLWGKIDAAIFSFLNGSLKDSLFLQHFWAFANHKLADWIEDFVILLFFVAYVQSQPKEERLKSCARLLFMILYVAAIIYFVNFLFFRHFLIIHRDSPTLVIDSSLHLSDQIPWLKIKDDSSRSFPGDHGTTALLFAAFFSSYARRGLALLASLYALFLCLPRMVTGAHWFSDIVVGSGSIALFFWSLAFCTPLQQWVSSALHRLFCRILDLKKKWTMLDD